MFNDVASVCVELGFTVGGTEPKKFHTCLVESFVAGKINYAFFLQIQSIFQACN